MLFVRASLSWYIARPPGVAKECCSQAGARVVVAASAPPVTKCVGTRHWAEVGTKYRLKLWLLIADARWRSNRPKQKSVGGLLSQHAAAAVPISRATLEGWMRGFAWSCAGAQYSLGAACRAIPAGLPIPWL